MPLGKYIVGRRGVEFLKQLLDDHRYCYYTHNKNEIVSQRLVITEFEVLPMNFWYSVALKSTGLSCI